jgi:predicted metal-dependent phosphoesterase TrpH
MRIDLHLHTTRHSPCSSMSPDDLMIAAKEAGLDAVCIPEHNRMWSADEARALSRQHNLLVLRGMEVTTTGGDVLVFGMDDEPGDELWTPAELKARVDRAGGLTIAAHPFRGFLLFGFSQLQMNLDDALENPVLQHVHGVEICNCMVTESENDLAKKAAEALGLAKVGGSDAHKAKDVGTCVMKFQGHVASEPDLIRAILDLRFELELVR